MTKNESGAVRHGPSDQHSDQGDTHDGADLGHGVIVGEQHDDQIGDQHPDGSEHPTLDATGGRENAHARKDTHRLRRNAKRVLIERVFDQSSVRRRVDPPVKVWVDVHRLLPRSPGEVYRDTPTGLDLDHEVIGLLSEWARRSDGGWLALVSYQLPARDGNGATELLTHYVPAQMIRRHSVVRAYR